jgi:hypothetical protein
MLLLASFVEGFQNFVLQLEGFFKNFQFFYAFEILFFFLMIYYVSKILRENDATKMMFIYWGLLVCGSAMYCFDPSRLFTKTFLFDYVLIVSALMLIFFNVEVKKML